MSLWKFKLPYTVEISRKYDFIRKPSQVTQLPWGKVETSGSNFILTVYKDYAWDGCSPKIKTRNSIFGIWDGFYHAKTKKPKAYWASMVHDFLYQYLTEHNISRKEADKIFYYLLKESNFWLAPLYYLAVRALGRLAINISQRRNPK